MGALPRLGLDFGGACFALPFWGYPPRGYLGWKSNGCSRIAGVVRQNIAVMGLTAKILPINELWARIVFRDRKSPGGCRGFLDL